MNLETFEAEINHGNVTVKEPEKLPERGRGLLIVLPAIESEPGGARRSTRVQLPIIPGNGQHMICPTPEELDASLWD